MRVRKEWLDVVREAGVIAAKSKPYLGSLTTCSEPKLLEYACKVPQCSYILGWLRSSSESWSWTSHQLQECAGEVGMRQVERKSNMSPSHHRRCLPVRCICPNYRVSGVWSSRREECLHERREIFRTLSDVGPFLRWAHSRC